MAITCHLLLLYQVPSSSHISIQYLLAHFRIIDSPLFGSSTAFGRFLLVFCRGLIIVRLLLEWFDRISQNFGRLSIYVLDQHFFDKKYVGRDYAHERHLSSVVSESVVSLSSLFDHDFMNFSPVNFSKS